MKTEERELWAKVINDARWYDGTPQMLNQLTEHFEKQGIVVKKRSIPDVSNRFSDDGLIKMALEMIYQMTGEIVPKEEQCRWQGNTNYQIAMTYLERVNNGC